MIESHSVLNTYFDANSSRIWHEISKVNLSLIFLATLKHQKHIHLPLCVFWHFGRHQEKKIFAMMTYGNKGFNKSGLFLRILCSSRLLWSINLLLGFELEFWECRRVEAASNYLQLSLNCHHYYPTPQQIIKSGLKLSKLTQGQLLISIILYISNSLVWGFGVQSGCSLCQLSEDLISYCDPCFFFRFRLLNSQIPCP